MKFLRIKSLVKISRTFWVTAGASINEMQIVLPARERCLE